MLVPGTLTPEHSERYTAALRQELPFEFAVERFRRQLEDGWREAEEAEVGHDLSGGGGLARTGDGYAIRSGVFAVPRWHGKPRQWRMGVRRLVNEGKHRLLGRPGQTHLWEGACGAEDEGLEALEALEALADDSAEDPAPDGGG
jgi:hypothetical protein